MSERRSRNRAYAVAALGVALGCVLSFAHSLAQGLPGMGALAGQVAGVSGNARLLALLVLAGVWFFRNYTLGRVAQAACGLLAAAACWGLMSGASTVEITAFAAIAGVSSAFLMLGLMLGLARLQLRDIALAGLVGLAVGGLLLLAIERLPLLPASLVVLASALGSGVLLALTTPAGRAEPAVKGDLGAGLAEFPWFAALMFAISGFLPSVLYGMDSALGWYTGAAMAFPLFAFSVVLVLVATFYIMLQGEEMLPAIWVPLFALDIGAMAVVCVGDAGVAATATALLAAGVFGCQFLGWVVFAALLSQTRVPQLPFAALALVLAGSALSVGAGEALAGGLAAGLQQPGGAVAMLALMLSLVFAAALLVTRLRERMAYGDALPVAAAGGQGASDAMGGEAESAPDGQEGLLETGAVDPLATRCDALVREFSLTPREAEIFKLTARGHSSTFIAEQLVISASTVRFHQQNIYRKLDVHSRQEVIALVNETPVSS